MAWDPTVPATNAALLSAPIRENFAALNGLAVGGVINPMTTPGDLIVGGTAGAPGRLGVGTNGHVLTLTAGLPTWAAPAGGVTYPLLAPDGSAAAPSYSFTTAPSTGLFVGGLSLGGDTILTRDSANTLAQKNGAAPQASRLFNTTDGTNSEWLETTWLANVLQVRVQKTGTGTLRELRIPVADGTGFGVRVMTTLNSGVQIGGANTATALSGGRVALGAGSSNTATSGTSRTVTVQELFSPTATSTLQAHALVITPTINYSHATPGAGNYEALRIAVTETALPTGQSFMIRCAGGAAGGTDVFAVTRDGAIKLGIPAVPATPPAGYGMLYLKADKKLYQKNDAGLEESLVGGSGVTALVALTQAAYDALTPKVATTLYVITP